MLPKSDLLGQTVDFDVRDTYIPSPAEVLLQRYGNQILQGKVMDVTSRDGGPEQYAVLRVNGVRDFVIVPCGRLRRSLLGPTG